MLDLLPCKQGRESLRSGFGSRSINKKVKIKDKNQNGLHQFNGLTGVNITLAYLYKVKFHFQIAD